MLFSIIIPTYNYANFLKHALQSAFEQHYKDFEVIVVDDGSTDNTLEVCQAFKNHYGKQINVIQQANAGPGAARNRGIDAAKGEFLLFLDADDELDRDALSYYRKVRQYMRAVNSFLNLNASTGMMSALNTAPGS